MNTKINKEEVEIHVLVTKRDGWWIAQGVEFDVVAQAKSIPDLEYEFTRMLVGHVATCEELGIEPFESLPPAPECVAKAYQMSRVIEFRLPRMIDDQPLHTPYKIKPALFAEDWPFQGNHAEAAHCAHA